MIKSVLIGRVLCLSSPLAIQNSYIDKFCKSFDGYVGCGYIKIHDITASNNRVINGTFDTDLNYWTVGRNGVDAGKAYYNPPSLPYTLGTLSQDTSTWMLAILYDFRLLSYKRRHIRRL